MPQQQITWSLHVPSSLSALRYHLCWYGVKSNNKMWDVMRNTLAILCWKSNTVCILNYKTIPSCIYSLSFSLLSAAAAIQFSLNHENLKSYSCLLLPSPPSPHHPFFSLSCLKTFSYPALEVKLLRELQGYEMQKLGFYLFHSQQKQCTGWKPLLCSSANT